MSTAREIALHAADGNPQRIAQSILSACLRGYPDSLIESYAYTAFNSFARNQDSAHQSINRFIESMLKELYGGLTNRDQSADQFVCGRSLYPKKSNIGIFASGLYKLQQKVISPKNLRAPSPPSHSRSEAATDVRDTSQNWLIKAEELGLFSEDYYRHTNPDLSRDINVRTHFIEQSYVEQNRDPSQHFSVSKYYVYYPDVYNARFNALQHYIEHGSDRHRFPSDRIAKDFERHDSSIDIDTLSPPEDFSLLQKSIVIVAHFHYPDVLDQVSSLLKETQEYADLIITTTSEASKTKIESILMANGFTRARVIVYGENRGRDLGAYFCKAQDFIRKYDYACKIHGKRSPHLGEFGERWSEYLFKATLGCTKAIRNIIWLFESNKNIGIIAPVPFAHITDNSWGENHEIAIDLCQRLELSDLDEAYPNGLRYPPATVFWHRPKCLTLPSNKISPDFFPEEVIPIDGTTAHALERLIPAIAQINGYSTIFYRLPSLLLRITEEWSICDWIRDCQDEFPIIIIGHDASNTGAPRIALSLKRTISVGHKRKCLTLLLGGGPLLQDYASIGDTIVFNNGISHENFCDVMKYAGKRCIVVTNTVVTASLGKLAKEFGHLHIALVHEHAFTGNWSSALFRNALDADCCIFPGARTANAAISYTGIAKQVNIEIMPQGIYRDDFPAVDLNTSYSSVRMELGIPQNALVVLGCGTIERRKGVDRFIEIAKLCKAAYESRANDKNIYFLWLGDISPNPGKERDWGLKLLKYIQDSNESNLIFPGSCIYSDRYFAASDLFLLTSRFDPFPGVVLEAMACSKPIICFTGSTDVDSAFNDGLGGLVLDYNCDIVCSELHELLSNNKLLKRMGEWNRNKIQSKHLFKHYANSILNIAESILDADKNDLSLRKDTTQPANILVSVIVPAYKTKLMYLQQLVDSLLKQHYYNWELCISCSALPADSLSYLSAVASSDPRVKPLFFGEVINISNNTNAALEISSGDLIIFVDHNDFIPPFCIKNLVEQHIREESDFIYSAEDKVDKAGRSFFAPVYKQEFSEDQLMQNNYMTHIVSIKRGLLDEVGVLNPEYDGAQDYDFILRATSKAKKITYIDSVLYHWRVCEESTSSGNADAKPYAIEAGRKALQDHLIRSGAKGMSVVN